MGLVVELRDLRTSMALPGIPVDDGLSLGRFASTSSDWHVSSGTVRRVARRVRPQEVDEVLSTPVCVPKGTMTVGRAIFIVPKVAVHGTLAGVAGGGVSSDACRLEREIQIDERARPLAQFLDEVVAQAPGIAWVLARDAEAPRETLSLGVMCPDGSMSLLGMSLSR